MRLLALLALFPILAHAGEFPVCDRKPQYARIELVSTFAPTQCVAEVWETNPLFGVLAALGAATGMGILGACTRYAPGTDVSRIVFDLRVQSEGADEVLGHELRHAFEPREFHPTLLPMVTLPCE